MTWWTGWAFHLFFYSVSGRQLSQEECRVSRQLVTLAQSCTGYREEGHRQLQQLGRQALPSIQPAFWTRLVGRLSPERLCADGLVAGSVFGSLAEMIFGELVDWEWYPKVSKESHEDTRYLEWQIHYLSLLGVVERMATFSLQMNGLNQDPLRTIQATGNFERCRPEFQLSSTKDVGFMGCLNPTDTFWSPETKAWTLPDRREENAPNSEVERVLNETDSLFEENHLVIYFPSSLVPSMRMMTSTPMFPELFKGVRCDNKDEIFPFGAGLTNGDVEIFQQLRQRLQVQRIFGIGNAFGYSTTILAKLWPSARLDLIDAETEGHCASVGSQVTRRITGRLEADVNLHIGFSPSDVPAAMRQPKNYELVFIDGQHTVEQLILDFEAVRPFLADRSVVVLHDIEFSFLQNGVKWIMASDSGRGFRYVRGKTWAYRNFLGTGMLMRGFTAQESAFVGQEVEWLSAVP